MDPRYASPSPARIACVWLPHVAVALEEREDLRRVGQAFVIVDAGDGPPKVLDRSYAAALQGVLPGQSLSQAQRICPGLAALPSRPAAYREVFGALMAALEPLGSALEPGGLDLLWLEVGGAAAGFAAEQAYLRQVLEIARGASGIEARVALADRRWSGQLMTRYLVGSRQTAVLPRGMDRHFLGGLPIKHLDLGEAARRRLLGWGLRRMAQFAALDRVRVTDALGERAGRAWERLQATERRPLHSWRDEPWLQAGADLGPRIRNQRSLEHHVQRLAADLSLGLRRHYRLAGGLRLDLDLVGGGGYRREVRILEPMNAGALAASALGLLPPARLPDSVQALRLAVQGLCRRPEAQPQPSSAGVAACAGVPAVAPRPRQTALPTDPAQPGAKPRTLLDPELDLRPWLRPRFAAEAMGSAAAD